MSNSVLVSILILIVVCLNISTSFGDSHSGLTTNNQAIFESKINILLLSITNDMPPGSETLYMYCNYDMGAQHILKPLQPYSFVSNFELKECELKLQEHTIIFDLYNSGKEGGFTHQKVFWSVRKDGLYHSWDNANWDKRENWKN